MASCPAARAQGGSQRGPGLQSPSARRGVPAPSAHFPGEEPSRPLSPATPDCLFHTELFRRESVLIVPK